MDRQLTFRAVGADYIYLCPAGEQLSYEPANRYNQGRVSAQGVRQRLGQADVLARAVGLDWKPTVDNYLGRVTKPRILEAVREAKGDQSVQLIDHLKKGDMAREAERLLDGTDWLPEPLRLVEVDATGQDADGATRPKPRCCAGTDEAGHAFQFEAGRVFRSEAGHPWRQSHGSI